MKRTTETDLVRACLSYLSLRHVFAWRNNTTGIYDPRMKKFRRFIGMKGVSDILGVLPGGRILAVECKAKGKYPTAEQKLFLKRIQSEGGVGIVARSVDDVKDALDSV